MSPRFSYSASPIVELKGIMDTMIEEFPKGTQRSLGTCGKDRQQQRSAARMSNSLSVESMKCGEKECTYSELSVDIAVE